MTPLDLDEPVASGRRAPHPNRPTPSAPESRSAAGGSVFWLPDQPILHAFPTFVRVRGTKYVPRARSLFGIDAASIVREVDGSRGAVVSGLVVQIVPGYSDGLAPDFHRLPAGPKGLIPVSFEFDSYCFE